MGVLPNEIPKDHNTGVLIALACSGRLITPELVIAMTMQPIPTHMNPAYLCVKGKKVEEARELSISGLLMMIQFLHLIHVVD